MCGHAGHTCSCLFICACFTKHVHQLINNILPLSSHHTDMIQWLVQTHTHTNTVTRRAISQTDWPWSHHSHTEGSVTRERGIQQQALSIQTGNPPQATHTCTHSHTHALQLCWINECSRVKDRAIQRGTQMHTHTHTSIHTLLREMKGLLGIREQNKRLREQYVSSDLNSLI